MATPTPSRNKDRILKKAISCLLFKDNVCTQAIGRATIERARKRVFQSAGVPSGGTDASNGDICLDYSNSDVYRHNGTNWIKISVES